MVNETQFTSESSSWSEDQKKINGQNFKNFTTKYEDALNKLGNQAVSIVMFLYNYDSLKKIDILDTLARRNENERLRLSLLIEKMIAQ